MDGQNNDVISKAAEYARQQAALTPEQVKGKLEEEKKAKPVPVPNAKRWLNKINRSKKVRKPFKEEAERYLRMYQGDYNWRRSRQRNYDHMSVNLVYAHIETITPSIFSGFPYIRVRPKPKAGESIAQTEIKARNMELVINYWFKELAVDEELKDILFDSFFGHAGSELGWETEIEEREEQFLTEDGSPGVKKEEIILKDKPFIVRRDPWNFIFDPDARRRRDCRWIALEEVMQYNDFLASPLYTDRAKQKLKPQTYPIDVENEQNWLGRDDVDRSEKEWVQIYTIWDKDTRQKFVVADGFSGFLNSDTEEGQPWPYEIEYKSDPYPFAILDAKRDRVSPYTWSEFKAAEPQIYELNRIRSAIQIHVKRSIPKYIYTEAAGTRGDVSKLMNARSDEAVKLNNLDAIRPFQNAEIPSPLLQFNEMAKEDLKVELGTSQFEAESLASTATEASILEGRDQSRKTLRSKSWEQYIVEISAKLGQLCQQNMSESLAMQIAGPGGIEWLSVSPEEIQGEFYYDIEPGIMEYKNEAIRKQQLLKFMEITRGLPFIDHQKVISKVAKELDLEGDEFVLPPDQVPPGDPPEPNIKFKDIDPAQITDPEVVKLLVKAGLSQNGIAVTPEMEAVLGASAPTPDLIAPDVKVDANVSMSGKDAAGMGANPNGNPMLPPVEGNLAEFTPGGAV